MTSRERILKTLLREPVDHIPMAVTGVCHGSTRFLNRSFETPFDEADYLSSIGLDTAVSLRVSRIISSDGVEIRYRTENVAGESNPIWVKEYVTPSGSLRQSIRRDAGYEHDSIPLFCDDHAPPRRSYKYLVDSEEELTVLKRLLKAPKRNELDVAYEFAEAARAYCDANGILMSAPLLGVGDPLMLFSGIENILFAAMDEPGFLHKYINILSDWNLELLRIWIDMGADMILRRGWYESSDFWSPGLYREFLLEPLRREVDLAHDAGLKYAYIMNSGVTPLADELAKIGIDILANVEPDKNDLALIKQKLRAGRRSAPGSTITTCLRAARNATSRTRSFARWRPSRPPAVLFWPRATA